MKALDRFFEQHPDSYHADRYIEPGYDQPETGILLANWNQVESDLMDELEAEGYELEWSDQWLVTDNGGAVRTSPDSYQWQPSYLVTDHGDIITIEDDASEWIAEVALTDYMQPMRALPDHITTEELTSEGFILHEEEYENGFHPGQTDDPKEVARHLFNDVGASEVVFQQTEQSQFYIKFSAWYKL